MDKWAGRGLVVARDSAVKLLTVIYDEYPPSLSLYSEYLGLRPTGSSRGVQVQFAEHLHRNMLWIPNPLGQHTFSCRAAEWPKRYRTIINPQ